MGLAASRWRSKEQAVPYRAKAVIYNVAGQKNGVGQGVRQEPSPQSGLHQKELGQTESGRNQSYSENKNHQESGRNRGKPRARIGRN